MLANALAVLAARERNSVASATFLTTLIDFGDTGIGVFIDESLCAAARCRWGGAGS